MNIQTQHNEFIHLVCVICSEIEDLEKLYSKENLTVLETINISKGISNIFHLKNKLKDKIQNDHKS